MIRSCALLVGLCCASVLAVPPTPVADPSAINKSRYLSMSVPSNGGEPMALRVTLVSLHHVVPPYGSGPSIPFTSFEGEIRWVGPPVFAFESDNDPTPLTAAPLQCTPYYHDWSTLGLFHVYGDAVVPNSSYDVVAMDETCMGTEEACADLSSSLTIATARYGDVISPFNPPTPVAQPTFDDHEAVVAKVRRLAGSGSKAIMQLNNSIPDPTRTVNLWDVLLQGNGIHGIPYPYSPTSCDAPRIALQNDDAEIVVARQGEPTLEVLITPVPAQGTSSYPVGTQIVGQELIAPTGGFRAFFEVRLQHFNPENIECRFRGSQIQVDAESTMGANADPPFPGIDLETAQEPCTTGSAGNTFCRNLFGAFAVRCESNQCTPAFVDTSRGDWVGGSAAFGTDKSPAGPIVVSYHRRPCEGIDVTDDGEPKYAGTIVLDIPSEASGRVYTLSVRQGSETMVVSDPMGPNFGALLDTPIAETHSAIVRVGMDSVAINSNRSRFISFVPGHSGEQMAIRVKLVSLHHVSPPYAGGPSVPFSSFEGEYRWVGPPTQYVESTSTSIPFYASTLQCAPHYQEWSTTGYLHVTGSAIVPSSQYEVQFVPASCMGNEDTCAEISAPLLRETTRWGDVETPYKPPALSIQPDLADVSALVNKFRSAPGAPIKARALLVGSDLSGNIDLTTDLSFIHISACVDAFRGAPYPHTGPEACP